MGHYKTGATRAEATPPEWLPVGKQIGALANEWSRRTDLIAYVGPGAGGPAPACYIPASAEIEVNVDVAFGFGVEPSDVDLTTRAGRYEFPKAVGAVYHEACHARFSHWNMASAHETLARDEYEALVLLEEGRIEAHGLSAMPKMLPFLRACAMEIVIADAAETFSEMSNTKAAANLVGLVYARVDSGILHLDDVTDVTNLVDDFLGLDVVARLREIAQEFQSHDNHYDLSAVYPLAKEWAALVRETAEEKGEESGSESGDEGEGGAGGADGMSEFIKEVIEALENAADNVAFGNAEDLEDAERKEKDEEVVKERAERAREVKAAHNAAAKVFGKGTAEISFGKSSSRLVEKRNPTPEERIAAVHVANMLEKAKYRERDVVEVRSAVPGGRLRARAMVQGAALRERGVVAQVEPWRRNVRRQTDEPTLTVGVMVDISGSMGSAMQPMATTAYVLSEATRRVQGRGAMVYYGSSVFPTLRVGEHLSEVKVYSAPDGTEKFDDAFRAIDGTLNLLHGSGARLLVIVSDGEYTGPESAAARSWMRRCEEEGVAVVWLPFDDGYGVKHLIGKSASSILAGRFSPTDAATKIGQVCADALTKVGMRMAS